MCIDENLIRPTIDGSHSVSDDAFIIGQEPDSLRGDFSSGQAYYGSITQLNMWGYVLESKTIGDMANCNDFATGNVIGWQKMYFSTNDAAVDDIEDMSHLCMKPLQLVMFPQQLTQLTAYDMCAIHGGGIVCQNLTRKTRNYMN